MMKQDRKQSPSHGREQKAAPLSGVEVKRFEGGPILSILICTIEGREESFDYITKRLEEQKINGFYGDKVEILHLKDNCEMTVGEKRNKLVRNANGIHLCFIDDDDDVPPYYLSVAMEYLVAHPDAKAVGFWGIKTTAGKNMVMFRHDPYFRGQSIDNGVFSNQVNHLNFIRSDIARKHKFPHINNGEDQVWAALINAECHAYLGDNFIDRIMYHYRFDPATTEARKEEFLERSSASPESGGTGITRRS